MLKNKTNIRGIGEKCKAENRNRQMVGKKGTEKMSNRLNGIITDEKEQKLFNFPSVPFHCTPYCERECLDHR
jgi:hypothetical protein